MLVGQAPREELEEENRRLRHALNSTCRYFAAVEAIDDHDRERKVHVRAVDHAAATLETAMREAGASLLVEVPRAADDNGGDGDDDDTD